MAAGPQSVCDGLRQSGLEQGSESDDEADASPYRINAYLRREFGLATPHAALSLSSLPDVTVATSPPPPLPPPSLLLDACGSEMRPLQPNTDQWPVTSGQDLGQLLLEYSGDEGQVRAGAGEAYGALDDEPGASMLPRELRSSNLTRAAPRRHHRTCRGNEDVLQAAAL